MSTQRLAASPTHLNLFGGGSEAWAITHKAWSRNDILVDQAGKALWICGTRLPPGTTCQVSALESKAQAATEGVSKRFLATLNGLANIHAASLRYCRRQLLFLTTHLHWLVPRNNLSLQNDMYGALGSAYLHLSIHGLSNVPMWISALLSLLHFL